MNQNSEQPHHAYPADRFNTRSAERVVPRVIDLLRDHAKVESVVDVGCGLGTWLAVFQQEGASDLLGLDADHVDRGALAIDPSLFQVCDLANPPGLDRRFDLALCLEVGEHLPEASAEGLVRFLAGSADVVLFSAAVPGQGGQAHVNEQWPAYWCARFKEHRFRCHDTLRYSIWDDEQVEWWYRQNLLLFLREGTAPGLTGTDPLPVVHPLLFEHTHARYRGEIRRKGGIRGIARELRVMARKLIPGTGRAPRKGP